MTRRYLIAGNWKMNGQGQSALALAQAIADHSASFPGVDIALHPPATLLSRVSETTKNTSVLLGGQDCHPKQSGAHTGDLSAEMLQDAGAQLVIVGHSERRSDHGESDQLVAEKALAAHRAGLGAIVCIGETLEERESDRTLEVLTRQLSPILEAFESILSEGKKECLIIAYEPVWAIGTGRSATPEMAAEVHGFIRNLIGQKLGKDCADTMRILYGGSMKPANAEALLAVPDIDGGLIGGASLKADDFMGIVKAAAGQ